MSAPQSPSREEAGPTTAISSSRSSGSPSHSFSSDCSRYLSPAGRDTDSGVCKSREVGSQQGSRKGRL